MGNANTLYYGDNLDILRRYVAAESVDLVYLDPPFNSKRDYNVLFREKGGEASPAQIEAFTDTWAWDRSAEKTYDDLLIDGSERVRSAVAAVRQLLGTTDLTAYLVMMAARLVELHRVLKPTGSLYLHCDPTASHYLKVLLDAIFGPKNFRNEIVWKRTGSHNDARKYADIQDNILYFAKGDGTTWNPLYLPHDPVYVDSHYNRRDDQGRRYRLDNIIRSASMGERPNLAYEYKGFTPQWGWRTTREKLEALDLSGRLAWSASGTPYLVRYLDEQNGATMPALWDDIPPINSQSAERLGYPTQKPLALLERIVAASSNPGDVVLDPFCGCGTAVVAAQSLGRRWLGIDVTHLAITLMRNRLNDSFPGIAFEVVGEPRDPGSARALAEQSRYQFQWWALSLVGARPAEGKEKKGADRGIDGVIAFVDDASGTPKRCLVQVKSGNVSSAIVRDLRGTIERERVDLGLLVTMDEPTRAMRQEAAEAGFYRSEGWGRDYPRLQIRTVAELLAGNAPELPPARRTFQQAERVRGKPAVQSALLEA